MESQKNNNSTLGAAITGVVVGVATTAAIAALSKKENRDKIVKKTKEVNKKVHELKSKGKKKFDRISSDALKEKEEAEKKLSKGMENVKSL